MSNYERIFKPTIQRLAHLLLRQYGCQMEYLHLSQLQGAVTPALRNQLIMGHTARSGEVVYIPVSLHQRLAGAAKLLHANHLSNQELRLVQQVAQMVIEASLLNLDRADLLDELEGQLQQMQQQHNVLPLSHYRPNPHPVENRSRPPEEGHFDFACLIESRDQDDIFKMALEIHHHSGRYAFLPYRDLSPDVWTDNENLRRLGHATIYFDNIAKLDLNLQRFLVGYLKTRVHLASPQIIVGTTLPYHELRNMKGILPEFLDLITIGYLNMARPFATYKRENLIDFFFGELSGRSRLGILDHSLSPESPAPH